jgi:hypothetical protein
MYTLTERVFLGLDHRIRRINMRKLIMAAVCLPAIVVASVITAAAAVSPTTGQPGAPTNTCGTNNPVTPGGSAGAPGSVFNPSGQAGTVYAGNPDTASFNHSNSTVAVSQYDTACVRLSHPPGS